MGGYIRNLLPDFPVDDVKRARDLAQGVGVYLGLGRSGDVTNLMYWASNTSVNGTDTSSGTKLDDDQKNTMRATVNSTRTTLDTRTCDLPIDVAPGGPPPGN